MTSEFFRRAAAGLFSFLPIVCFADGLEPASVHALIQKYGCLSCHGMVHAQVGPGFAQVAARYRTDSTALSRLPAKIAGGSVGTWGRVIMPRQVGMTEPEARALAQWVLSLPPAP